MSRMSEINQTIKEINNWFKDHLCYILAIIFVLVIAICVYGQADKDIAKAREKENKISNIENRLTRQENYMHEVKADIDNLYEVIEK